MGYIKLNLLELHLVSVESQSQFLPLNYHYMTAEPANIQLMNAVYPPPPPPMGAQTPASTDGGNRNRWRHGEEGMMAGTHDGG